MSINSPGSTLKLTSRALTKGEGQHFLKDPAVLLEVGKNLFKIMFYLIEKKHTKLKYTFQWIFIYV